MTTISTEDPVAVVGAIHSGNVARCAGCLPSIRPGRGPTRRRRPGRYTCSGISWVNHTEAPWPIGTARQASR
ncbi:hypothetical protein [Actinokineospora sp.]|uniref:hypothetical protein n=1 Tax=Actinokineospora sp. TaxID=1872133 RepID=UPI0040380A40